MEMKMKRGGEGGDEKRKRKAEIEVTDRWQVSK